MVVEVAVSGGDRPGRWWGSDEGVAPVVLGAEGGHREAARVRAREAMVAASAVRPGEEDDWAGPTCQRERAGRAGWAGQRSRPSGGWWQRPNGSGPTELEGEVGRGGVESGAGPELKKKFFSNFN
jgi:hypothetical protein